MQALRELLLFSVWQQAVVHGLALVAGTGAGAGVVAGSSVWAKDGAAKATAARAAMLAIKRRIGTSPGPPAMRGTVRPRYSGKMLWYLGHLCQILNRLQQLKSQVSHRRAGHPQRRLPDLRGHSGGLLGRPLAHPG